MAEPSSKTRHEGSEASPETRPESGPETGPHSAERAPDRRQFLSSVSRAAMVAGLAGGYGGLALVGGRFLYPARPGETAWQYVATIDSLRPGEALAYQGPAGETINIARQGSSGGVDDFVALSSTCPHLGCQVHWEGHNNRFFCPCHNGTFDESGVATGGPPGDAGQSLPRYPLKVEGDLLYIEVPVARQARGDGGSENAEPSLRAARGRGLRAPGHDACLGPHPSSDDEPERS